MKKRIILAFVRFMAKAHVLSPIWIARLRFFYILHRWPDFEHPKDINEKINWLKFYGDTSQWSTLADKYAVRQYIESIGQGDILVKLYGKWDRAEDIDWGSLPERFVMKGNAGSGDVVICRNKNELDKEKVTKYFQSIMGKSFGDVSGESHYAQIKPCIIAEELLDASTQPCGSTSLVDYKIWCFDGKPKYIWCCYNREKYHANVGLYDMDWNYHPEWSVFTSHYVEASALIPKPACFDKMMDIAAKLSAGFPQVRIDLYEVNGHVCFGEYTFSSQGGYMDFYTKEFLEQMGRDTKLPCDKD